MLVRFQQRVPWAHRLAVWTSRRQREGLGSTPSGSTIYGLSAGARSGFASLARGVQLPVSPHHPSAATPATLLARAGRSGTRCRSCGATGLPAAAGTSYASASSRRATSRLHSSKVEHAPGTGEVWVRFPMEAPSSRPVRWNRRRGYEPWLGSSILSRGAMACPADLGASLRSSQHGVRLPGRSPHASSGGTGGGFPKPAGGGSTPPRSSKSRGRVKRHYTLGS